MNILVIGSGGREHAICEKIKQNDIVKQVFVLSNNNALKSIAIPIKLDNILEIVDFVKNSNIALTIVGSEELLVEGIVDEFKKNNLNILGPDKKGAMLEGSKGFAKNFMERHNIKTASYEVFENKDEAFLYVKKYDVYPVVVKFDGLAAGKGVKICQNLLEAERAIVEGLAHSRKIVIEEFLNGWEVSILSLFDGKTILPLLSAKDHKRALDNDLGKNTGGMGVICPHPLYNQEIEAKFIEEILLPTQRGLISEDLIFLGFIFFGLMICNDEIYVLEYNMRMGDPETQAVLPLLKNDFFNLLDDCLQQKLSDVKLQWQTKSSCCVVLSSQGYPDSYNVGYKITYPADLKSAIYLAGVECRGNELFTSGGRVLNVVALGDDLKHAREQAYNDLNLIEFKGKTFRTDIGKKE